MKSGEALNASPVETPWDRPKASRMSNMLTQLPTVDLQSKSYWPSEVPNDYFGLLTRSTKVD